MFGPRLAPLCCGLGFWEGQGRHWLHKPLNTTCPLALWCTCNWVDFVARWLPSVAAASCHPYPSTTVLAARTPSLLAARSPPRAAGVDRLPFHSRAAGSRADGGHPLPGGEGEGQGGSGEQGGLGLLMRGVCWRLGSRRRPQDGASGSVDWSVSSPSIHNKVAGGKASRPRPLAGGEV
jgi:hypothetical protein